MIFLINTALGHYAAQLRLVFCENNPTEKEKKLLALVQPFKPARNTIAEQEDGSRAFVTDDNVEMFRVVREKERNGARRWRVIELSEIWRPIELIPLFYKKCPSSWTSSNSLELAEEFYVNCFSDKETYQSVW